MKKKFLIKVFGMLSLVAFVGCGQADQGSEPMSNAILDTSSESSETDVPEQEVNVSQEVNTYNATSSFYTHKNLEHDIFVSLDIDGKGVIVDADVDIDDDGNRQSARYSTSFLEGYKSYVVGQSIEQLDGIGIIAGASDTTDGFNDALDMIQQQIS